MATRASKVKAPAIGHVRCHGRLHQLLAMRARPLASDMVLHREYAPLVVELLEDDLAGALHLATAAAHIALGLVGYLAPR